VADGRCVAIVGGGLAGVAAAVRLAEHSDMPVIIETRKRLGGRATSLTDPRSGETIDNCQHVLMGCCTNLIDFYDRLGVNDQIEWHPTLYWTRGRGEIDVLKPGRLPAPLHLAFSFNKLRVFDKKQKRHIARGLWKIMRMGFKGRPAWADRTFAQFLQTCRQPEDVVRSFWNTIIVSACNLEVDRVSAASALHVFQDAFLANAWSATMGLATVPLGALYDPAVRIIEEAGGEVRLGCSAKAISFDGDRVTGVVTEDGLVEAAAVISAVPWDRLDKLASDTMKRADARLRNLNALQVSPILGVHLWFEHEVMNIPHLVLVDRGVQWLFNKGVDADGRQHLHAVISAADAWMELDEAEIVRRVLEDVHHVLPTSKGLQPVEARSIKEKRATFAATPASERQRPSTAPAYAAGGAIENLLIAGDWTDTGWPATMEGAVRSGYAAAGALLGKDLSVEEVPPTWLARLLGLR